MSVPKPVLVEAFKHLVGANGGTDAIRGLVLLLAVQGRLMDEEPLPVEMTPCAAGLSVTVGLPKGWSWSRVEDVGELKLGRQRSPKNHNGPNMRPYLRVANVFEARIDTSDVMAMNFEPDEVERFRLLPNDLLLNEGQSYELVGRPAIYRGEVPGACFQNTLIRFRPTSCLLPEYALSVFRAYMRTGRFRREAQQTTNIAHLSLGRLAQIEFPLPPLAEQKRIVEKVDQLMALCDELEARQTKKRALSDRLTKSALQALTTAESPEDFDTAWKRVVDNFDTLIDRKEKVGDLRGAVLALAMQGRLSDNQTDSVEPLRVEVRRARDQLAKNGVRVRDLPPAEHADVPWSLPTGWAWVRLGELGGFLGGGTPSKSNTSFWSGPLPWVSPKDMKQPYIDDAEDHISVAAVEESAAKLIPKGSVLCVVRGMILAHSFPVALTRCEVAINQDMKALVLAVPAVGEFVLRACQDARARVLASVERSSHGTCRLDGDVVENLRIPLPPLVEQRRLVAKVDELMKICDELEARLTRAEELASTLVEAVVQELVA